MSYSCAKKNSEYNKKYWQANKERLKTQNRLACQNYYQRNVLQFKQRNYKNKYGITNEEYETLLAKQNHSCALCNTDFSQIDSSRIHVDHDHSSGKVRGILCMPCNVGLGMLGDSIEGLENALTYLKETS